MEKLTLTFVERKQAISPKTGKPYERLSIKTSKHGNRFLSGFGSAHTRDWKVGDEVEIKVEEVASADGTKKYLNFDYPRANPATDTKRLEITVDLLKKDLTSFKETMRPMYEEWKKKTPLTSHFGESQEELEEEVGSFTDNDGF